jgi:hypothetical protein
MPLKLFALALLVTGLVTGCNSAFLTPPTGPGTDWPCGYTNTFCGEDSAPGEECCGYREWCKAANLTHPKPYCEYMGPENDLFGASRERPRFTRPL